MSEVSAQTISRRSPFHGALICGEILTQNCHRSPTHAGRQAGSDVWSAANTCLRLCLQMLHLIKITFVVPIIRQWWTLHCCLREERETGGVGWLWASPCRNVLLWSEILQTLRWKITHHTGTGTWFQRVQQKSGFAGCYFTVYLV